MKMLYMLIGLPRAGKTTWAKRKQKNDGAVIVSADAIRYLVYGQRFWGEGEPLMWSIRSIVLKMLMEQGVNIIIDETNTKRERRQPIIEMAKAYRYGVVGVVITTSEKTCIARAEAEGDEAIIPVIKRMAEQHAQEPPAYGEGFDEIKGG